MRALRLPVERLKWAVNIVLVLGGLELAHQVVTGSSMLRISAAVGLMVMMGVPALQRPQTAMLAMFAWLPFLGLARRALIPAAGWSSLDPLLLVSTAIALMVFITLMISKKTVMGGTALAKIFFAFLVVVVLELFNPLQGSPLVALTGVMYIVIPMTTFIVARTIGDEQYTAKVQRLVLATGVITALWGLKQVYIGFTGFEQQWINCCAYGAVKINQTIRPFSTFTNSLEFGGYMGFGVAICVSRMLYSKGYARILLAGCAALMGWAGFLVGSRGLVILTFLALFALAGLRVRSRMAGVGIVVALVGLSVWFLGTHRQNPDNALTANAGADQLVQQQITALTNPFDPRVSSLHSHTNRFQDAFLYSLKNTAGFGTGSITQGGQKFRQGTSASAEIDFGNVFLAYGLIGGIMYPLLAMRVFWQLYVLRRRTLSPMWAAVLAMCIMSLGQWQNGGTYALSSLIWFMIGASDKAFMELPRVKRFAHPNAVAEAAGAAA
jgi:hypothetical protein